MAESYFSRSDADKAEVLEVGRERTGRPAHLMEKGIWRCEAWRLLGERIDTILNANNVVALQRTT